MAIESMPTTKTASARLRPKHPVSLSKARNIVLAVRGQIKATVKIAKTAIPATIMIFIKNWPILTTPSLKRQLNIFCVKNFSS
jgi:hypothetical protein